MSLSTLPDVVLEQVSAHLTSLDIAQCLDGASPALRATARSMPGRVRLPDGTWRYVHRRQRRVRPPPQKMVALRDGPSSNGADVASLVRLATDMAEAGELEGSLNLFVRVIAMDSHNVANLASRARRARSSEMAAQLLMELERHAEALAMATQAADGDPGWPVAQVTLGRAALNAGEYAASLAAFRRAEALAGGAGGGAAGGGLDAIDPTAQADLDEVLRLTGEIERQADDKDLPVGDNVLRIRQRVAACPRGDCGDCGGWRGRAQPETMEDSATVPNNPPAAFADSVALACASNDSPLQSPQSHPQPSPSQSSRGTSAVIWECGICLAQHLCRLYPPRAPDTGGASDAGGAAGLRGKSCLDIGAGTGIVGLAAAALGARSCLTDLPEALGLIRENIEMNRTVIVDTEGAPPPVAIALDWNDVGGEGGAEAVAVGGANRGLYEAYEVNNACELNDAFGADGAYGVHGQGDTMGDAANTAATAAAAVPDGACEQGVGAIEDVLVAAGGGAFDIVVAADLVYNRRSIGPLVQLLRRIIGKGGRVGAGMAREGEASAQMGGEDAESTTGEGEDKERNTNTNVSANGKAPLLLWAHKTRHPDVDDALRAAFRAQGFTWTEMPSPESPRIWIWTFE